MICPLCILDTENIEHTKFPFIWPTSFRDINSEIDFYMQISKYSMCLGFEVGLKYLKKCYVEVLGTERGSVVVTHETRIREVPGSNPVAVQPD